MMRTMAGRETGTETGSRRRRLATGLLAIAGIAAVLWVVTRPTPPPSPMGPTVTAPAAAAQEDPPDPRATPTAPAPGAGPAAPAAAIAEDEHGNPLAGGRRALDAPVTGPGVIVLLEAEDGTRVAVYPTAAGEFLRPVEAHRGPFRLSAFLPGTVGRFLVGPEGVRPADIDEGRRFRFRSAGAGAVRIRVSDDADRPVGARVRIERDAAGLDWVTVAHVDVDPATGEGLVRIEGAGAYRALLLQSSSRAVAPMEAPRVPFEVRAGETTTVPFLLASACGLDVRAVDPEGEPVRRALVDLRYRDAGVVRASSKSGWTDEEGLFRYTGLEPGAYVVLVTAPGRVPASESVSVVRGESREMTIRLRTGGCAIRGRLVGLDAEGLRRLNVFAVKSDVSPELRHAVWGAELDREEATFRLSGLGTGRYDLCLLSGDAKLLATVDTSAPDTDLGVLDLRPLLATGPGTLALQVVSRDPLAATATTRIHFSVRLREESWPVGLWWQRSAFLDRTRVPGLPAGRYRIAFAAPSNDPTRYDLSAEAEFTIPEEGGTVEVDLPAPVLR